jgi:hypothetical protein
MLSEQPCEAELTGVLPCELTSVSTQCKVTVPVNITLVLLTGSCVFADCGAGVGRVSEQLLLRCFHTVDLLEPSRHLLDAAQVRIRLIMSD